MSSESATPPVPRDAASMILIRRAGGASPRVLMGQRGAAARFMPSKFVFPGGALDPCDATFAGGSALSPLCARRLGDGAAPALGRALALAAIRETFEETGLALGAPDPSAESRAESAPGSWGRFLARGMRPALDHLTFIFRAITPPTRSVRFDARFFMTEVDGHEGDLDDFSTAEDELSHLSWLTLEDARRLDLPFITTVVLAEVEERLNNPDPERPAPFFHHEGGRSFVDALK